MSKIKTEEIYACQERNTKGAAVDAIMSLIKQREEEFAELVEAAVLWHKECTTMGELHDAIKPFLPPPSLADRLDAVADRMNDHGARYAEDKADEAEIRAIAAEYREKHGGGE